MYIYERALEENCVMRVHANANGTYSVTVLDLDANETFGSVKIFQEEQAAIEYVNSELNLAINL